MDVVGASLPEVLLVAVSVCACICNKNICLIHAIYSHSARNFRVCSLTK